MPSGRDSDRFGRTARAAERDAAAWQALARLTRENAGRAAAVEAEQLEASARAHDRASQGASSLATRARTAERDARSREGWSALTALTRGGHAIRTAIGFPQADPVLDRLARLAARVLGTPVALVSLLEDNQQVFAGQVGIPADHPYARSSPLTHAFCLTAAALRGPVTTSDARTDARFAGNPAIEDLGVIAYAAWPLLTADDGVLGALCAIDSAPREWSEDDLEVLRDLADAAVAELEGRAARHLTQHALERDAHIATTLQHSLLPEAMPLAPGVRLAGRYRPAENLIGGDWYDAFRLPGERIGIAIGNVVGHGIEAAATAGRLRNALRGAVLEDDDPGEVLGRLNDLARVVPLAAWSSMAFGILDVPARRWSWARAGHPAMYLRSDATRVCTGPAGALLGVAERGTPFAADTLTFDGQTDILLHTDGLIEQRGRRYQERVEELRARIEAGPEDPEELWTLARADAARAVPRRRRDRRHQRRLGHDVFEGDVDAGARGLLQLTLEVQDRRTVLRPQLQEERPPPPGRARRAR